MATVTWDANGVYYTGTSPWWYRWIVWPLYRMYRPVRLSRILRVVSKWMMDRGGVFMWPSIWLFQREGRAWDAEANFMHHLQFGIDWTDMVQQFLRGEAGSSSR